MADHLIAVNVLKKITIEIMSNDRLRITIDGFNKDVCEHVSREYTDKTAYIVARYCPEMLSEA